MNKFELERLLNQKLNSLSIKDYVENGLQIEGQSDISRIITGVTASKDLIDRAITHKADAILVHHGYFWKNESPLLRGMKYRRIKALIEHDINLFAYHLPLDLHPTLGNNAMLGKLWNVENIRPLDEEDAMPLVVQGELSVPMSGDQFRALLETTLSRKPLHIGDNAPDQIHRIAWCSGAAQDYLERAAEYGVDAFITGEVSERTTFIAREMGIHFYAAGHHATERYGVKALGEWLADEHQLDVTFIDIDNPV